MPLTKKVSSKSFNKYCLQCNYRFDIIINVINSINSISIFPPTYMVHHSINRECLMSPLKKNYINSLFTLRMELFSAKNTKNKTEYDGPFSTKNAKSRTEQNVAGTIGKS